LNVLFRHKLTALGLRQPFANGCAGLVVEIIGTARPFLRQREQDRSKGILVFLGKGARLGNSSV
jgi:hypothetical protein